MRATIGLVIGAALTLSGCAGLVFSDGHDLENGVHFYDAAPHLLMQVAADCTIKSEVVSLPGKPRTVRLRSGYGSSELSVALQNGVIASVGQKSDTAIPATISAVSGLATAVDALGVVGPKPKACTPKASLFAIVSNGTSTTIDKSHDLLDYTAN